MSLWVFGVQVATGMHPFIELAILKDRNLMVATLFGFFIGILMFSTMALLPNLMQVVLGYPVAYAGIISMPRGLGSFFSMLLVGQLIGRVNARVLLLFGLSMMAVSFWQMTGFNLTMDATILEVSGFLSGLGMGFIFIPMNVMAFASISPQLRAEASGFYTLIRNIGSSVGISIMQASFVRGVTHAHSGMVENVRPDNPLVQAYMNGSFDGRAALTMLDGMIWRQAMMVSYVNGFTALLVLCLLTVPLIFLMRTPKPHQIDSAHAAVE